MKSKKNITSFLILIYSLLLSVNSFANCPGNEEIRSKIFNALFNYVKNEIADSNSLHIRITNIRYSVPLNAATGMTDSPAVMMDTSLLGTRVTTFKLSKSCEIIESQTNYFDANQ